MPASAPYVDVAFWLKAAGVGLVSGVLSGMFGIGGGLVTTPAVRLLLGGSAIASIASTLPAIIPAALSGATTYVRAGIADVRAGVSIGLAGALMAVGGAYLTRFIGGGPLLVVTAVIIGYMAVDMALPAFRRPAQGATSRTASPRVPSTPRAFALLGAVTGLYSGLLGLGGGFVIVPVLTRWFGFPIKRAIGTSLVAIGFLAVPATVTHALLGHIDWRIALSLAVTVVPGALLGARITRVASERSVRVAFALLLLAAAVLLAGNELGVLGR